MHYRDEAMSAVGCVPSGAASRAKVRPRHTERSWRSNWPTVPALTGSARQFLLTVSVGDEAAGGDARPPPQTTAAFG